MLLFSASWGCICLYLVRLTTNTNVVDCCIINTFIGNKRWFILAGQLMGWTQEVQCNLVLIVFYKRKQSFISRSTLWTQNKTTTMKSCYQQQTDKHELWKFMVSDCFIGCWYLTQKYLLQSVLFYKNIIKLLSSPQSSLPSVESTLVPTTIKHPSSTKIKVIL